MQLITVGSVRHMQLRREIRDELLNHSESNIINFVVT
jgi:hypothetical protein